MEVNGAPDLLCFPHSSEYLPLCSAEQTHSYRFGTTWEWVNDNTIFLFWWIIPLSASFRHLRCTIFFFEFSMWTHYSLYYTTKRYRTVHKYTIWDAPMDFYGVFNRTFQPKMKIVSENHLLTLMLFRACMTFFCGTQKIFLEHWETNNIGSHWKN